MPAILAAVLEVASNVLEVLAGVTTIQNFLSTFFGGGPTLLQLQDNITETFNTLNSNNQAYVGYFQQIISALQSLGAKVDNISNGGSVIQLPPTPPAGYGGGATANDVWSYPTGYGFETTGSFLNRAGTFALRLGERTGVQFVARDNPFFTVQGFWDSYVNSDVASDEFALRQFDTADLLTYPSLLAWLNAHKGSNWSVGLDASGYYILQIISDPSGDFAAFTTMNEAQFAAVKKAGATASVPPVWPGLANVTLGAPVALADGATITAPMDGVIVKITGEAGKKGTFEFGSFVSYRQAGGLIFLNDNGDAEFPQIIGLQDGIYSPRIIKRAASVIFRTDGTAVGTITPWIAN